MAEVKRGPAVVLDHTVMFDMLADPGFYAAVPALYFLKAQALAVVNKVQSEILVPGSTGCAGCADTRKMIAPLVDAIARVLVPLHRENPAAVMELVDYLTARLKYRPQPVTLVSRYGKLEL